MNAFSITENSFKWKFTINVSVERVDFLDHIQSCNSIHDSLRCASFVCLFFCFHTQKSFYIYLINKLLFVNASGALKQKKNVSLLYSQNSYWITIYRLGLMTRAFLVHSFRRLLSRLICNNSLLTIVEYYIHGQQEDYSIFAFVAVQFMGNVLLSIWTRCECRTVLNKTQPKQKHTENTK